MIGCWLNPRREGTSKMQSGKRERKRGFEDYEVRMVPGHLDLHYHQMDRQQTYALELLKRRLLELEQSHEVETKMLKDFVELRYDDMKSRIQRISRLCEQAALQSQTAGIEST